MKRALLITLVLISFTGISQKIKNKNFIVTVDDKELCKVQKEPGIKGSYYFTDLKGENLIYVKWNEAHETAYFEIFNPNDLDNIIFEYPNTARKPLIKSLYLYGVVTFDGLNEKKLIEYGKKIGKPYTEKRESDQH